MSSQIMCCSATDFAFRLKGYKEYKIKFRRRTRRKRDETRLHASEKQSERSKKFLLVNMFGIKVR